MMQPLQSDLKPQRLFHRKPKHTLDIPQSKGTSGCKETERLNSSSEPTTYSTTLKPKTCPEPPQHDRRDTNPTFDLKTQQQQAQRPLTCAIVRFKTASVVPRVVVAVPIVLVRAGRLSVVSRVESSVRNTGKRICYSLLLNIFKNS